MTHSDGESEEQPHEEIRPSDPLMIFFLFVLFYHFPSLFRVCVLCCSWPRLSRKPPQSGSNSSNNNDPSRQSISSQFNPTHSDIVLINLFTQSMEFKCWGRCSPPRAPLGPEHLKGQCVTSGLIINFCIGINAIQSP